MFGGNAGLGFSIFCKIKQMRKPSITLFVLYAAALSAEE